ncbi:regulatory protein RecX [Flavobacterium cucumis]|uniref:Regulatory protein RecX n=1 Tax=Flavobacterium cucumis TaxID=416016 RepID=A0A1M7ZUT2_9FLAO|nr:regulatory protein RecX [Flavobacterium cucumis]SHO72632.1 regulatory protein [Flavobacterium cucumis]
MKAEKNQFTKKEIQSKLEYYCAYQERCYKEVEEKLYSFSLNLSEKEEILTYLIEHNFINEERFAQSFVRGKHNYKFWGKNRIVNELKFRNISSRIITSALKEISEENYLENFHKLAEKHWNNITERKGPKKNKKFVDFLLRKGYETHLIYDKLNELNN